MLLEWHYLIVCSLAVASVSWTVTNSKVFHPFRLWVTRRSNWLGELVTCHYCFSHYLAAAGVFVLDFRLTQTYGIVDFIVAMFAAVTLSSAFAGLVIRYSLGSPSNDTEKIERYEIMLGKAKAAIQELQKPKNP